MTNPLKVIAVDKQSSQSTALSRRQEAQAKFERLWLLNPQKFNPLRNCLERERIDRTWRLIRQSGELHQKLTTDLGCGFGVIAQKLSEKGARVDAIDVASNALKHVPVSSNINPLQDYVPKTKLVDSAYDWVISTDLIALLPIQEHRLYFSELARLVKSDGWVVCSTAVDFNSEDSLQQFATLAETEFNIENWILSYHRLYIQLLDFFKAPGRFAKASQNSEYRKQELERRFSISRWWFRLNSHKPLGAFWSVIAWITHPIVNLIKQSKGILLFLEPITKFLWPENGISHVIFFGKKAPINYANGISA